MLFSGKKAAGEIKKKLIEQGQFSTQEAAMVL
jgi:hypothetical protein